MLLAGEYSEERAKHRLEPPLRFLRGKLWDGYLLTHHELELGDELYNKLTVGTHGIPDRVTPAPDLKLSLAQNLPHHSPEGLGESPVRDVALILIELTRNEDATGRNNYLVKLVHDRGLADTGITGY